MNLQNYRGKTVCVALSGGVDSVSLLHYLKANAFACGYFLAAVNCEHGIRGESSLQDTRFVQDLCEKEGIRLYCFSEDCLARAKREKVSVETAARNFRYQCFEKLLQEKKCDYIALAHHADDEAETVLFRLSRGTALEGLTAMTEENGGYLRPFLSWDKKKITAYAVENALAYCVDESNFERDSTRNILRLDVLPRLNEAIDGATENLLRFAKIAAEDDALLYSLSDALIVQGQPRFAGDSGWKVLFSKEKPLFRRACLTVLKGLGITKDYTRRHLDSLVALQASQTGSTVDLPKGIVAKREYDGISFFLNTQENKTSKEEEIPFNFGRFAWGRYEITVSKEPLLKEESFGVQLRFDADKIPSGSVFRARKTGDVFRKFGGGEKSLKKYLIDEKIPAYLRAELPILADGDRVLLVGGVQIADEIKVTEATVHAAYLIITERRQ